MTAVMWCFIATLTLISAAAGLSLAAEHWQGRRRARRLAPGPVLRPPLDARLHAARRQADRTIRDHYRKARP